ncbi:MAG: hypothetical protein ACLP1Y_09370 [Candidatus Acidiferrales bacterium]
MCIAVKMPDGSVAIVCGGHARNPEPAMKKRAAAEIQFPATVTRLEAAGYRFKYSRACRRCGAMIEFWLTPARKWAPLERLKESAYNERGSHFATCPFADEFRKTTTQLEMFS